ncbi:MAG: class I SAM-dependent methyltransferase [Actinomycetota bacterium]|nr:class I SAM-dependent methyltransferase [Actinomycetota bacterium]
MRSSSAVVEIGSYLGRSTVAIASGVSGAPIYAVDPHTGDITEAQRGELVDTYSEFMHNIEAAGALHKITPMRMMSVSAAAQYSGPPIGFLFVDGWHSADAVEEDIRNWQPYFADEITVIFDDWQEPEVSAGITRVLSLLPHVVGSIGKDLIFTNSAEVKHLPIVKFASRYAQVRQASEKLRIADDLLRAFR